MKNLLLLALACFLLFGKPRKLLLILAAAVCLFFGGLLKKLIALPLAAIRFIGGSVKALLSLLLAVCLLFGLTGCTKDQILDVYNQTMQAIGVVGVTPDSQLVGRRTFDSDSYSGRYEAEYDHFTGMEIPFGGTALERTAGNALEITCELSETSGSLKVEWKSGVDEPKLLFEGAGTHTASIQLPGGSNYIRISGDDFTGTIALEVR